VHELLHSTIYLFIADTVQVFVAMMNEYEGNIPEYLLKGHKL